MADLSAFPDFLAAARAVLADLRLRVPLDAWMVARQEGATWTVLAADGNAGPAEGTPLVWDDTLCRRMVEDGGPRCAPDVARVPLFAAADVTDRFAIGAYVGVPLNGPDGVLLGTMCAISRHPVDADVAAQLPLVELQARLLASLLHAQLAGASRSRAVERLAVAGHRDDATGLVDGTAWQALLAAEDDRCRQLGDPAGVIVVHVDGGDDALRGAVDALRPLVRAADVLARVGDDELAVLVVPADLDTVEATVAEAQRAVTGAGLIASAAGAVRTSAGLQAAWTGATTTARSLGRHRRSAGASISEYHRCPACDRRGAYVSGRLPLIRCKFCRQAAELEPHEWQEALQGAATYLSRLDEACSA